VTLEASEIFKHMVVYTPSKRDFFCLENQTCSTDAHNLYEKGFTEEAHLLILEPVGSPGSVVEGSLFYRVEVEKRDSNSPSPKEQTNRK
jgi:aldose 1-epimerase